MRKIILSRYGMLAVFCTCLLSFNLFAQCDNFGGTAWGTATVPTNGTTVNINTCQYPGEYATIYGVLTFNLYTVTSSNCGDYITVYGPNQTLIGSGQTPYTFVGSASGDYTVHFSVDENCTAGTGCRETNISCSSCGAIGGCMDPAAFNFNSSATFDDCSCNYEEAIHDECLNAIDLTSFVNTNGACGVTHHSVNNGATFSSAEGAPSPGCTDNNPTPLDIWYKVTVPSSGVLGFEFISTPGFSALVELYTGSCGNLEAYTPTFCNNQRARSFPGLTPGDEVYLRVWDHSGTSFGSFEICVREEIPGCTDPEALNYEPNATFNNGTCDYPVTARVCDAPVLVVNAACVEGDNTGLGTDAGEPSGNCFSGENNTIWYKFEATTSSTNISTDFAGYGNGDTEIAVYLVGDCNNFNTFIELGCDQDGGFAESYNSTISGLPTTIGDTYFVQVSGWNGEQGSFCIQVSSPPINDDICGAISMTCGETINATTGDFTMNAADITASCGSGGLSAPNAFYKISGTGDDFTASLCNSAFDTRLDVFCMSTGDCNTTPEFSCVGGNDDSPSCTNITNSEVKFPTMLGKDYYIMVHAFGTTSGNFELTVNCNDPVIGPENQDCKMEEFACRTMGEAKILDVSSSCSHILGTNVAASAALVNPSCAASNFQTSIDVWYKFYTGNNTDFDIDVIPGSASDLSMAMYNECGAVEMDCHAIGGAMNMRGLAINTEYFIQIFTASGDEGSFGICVKSAPDCASNTLSSGTSIDEDDDISWTAVPNADGYNITIGTSPGTSDFLATTDVGNVLTFDPGTFPSNQNYYVNIVAYNSAGDAYGCEEVMLQTSCPVALVDVDNMIDATCKEAANGQIDITVNNGAGTNSYAWEGPDGFVANTEDITGLNGGVYDLTITNMSSGCSTVKTYTVEPTKSLSSEYTVQNAACGTVGAIDVSVSGGVAPYNYSWSTGQNTEDVTGLNTGAYDLTITDANNCTIELEEIEVVDMGGLELAVDEVASSTCNSINGSISLTPSNGVGPFTYTWIGPMSGSVTSPEEDHMIQNLAEGIYDIMVSDASGCVGYLEEIVIEQSNSLNIEMADKQNVNCHESADGALAVTVTGGSGPYQFNWSIGVNTPTADATNGITGLTGGNYFVTVTDGNGCVGISEVMTIEEPNLLTVQVETVSVLDCHGNADGTIEVNVSGGEAPYTYLWDNGAETKDIADLEAGEYSFVATDANGCQVQSPMIEVIQPTAPVTAEIESVDHVSCFDYPDGKIRIIPTGGVPPYHYNWTNGEEERNLFELVGGEYQCTITDAKGCTFITPMVTIETPEESLELIVDGVLENLCDGEEDGSVFTSIIGGEAPYNINWSNGANTEDINSLNGGSYIATVTDASGCMVISPVLFVPEPAPLEAQLSSTNANNGNADGTASVVIVDGGTAPYSYIWDANANNQTTATATGLAGGSYDVTITDANDCQLFETVVVEALTNSISLQEVSKLALFPNPTNNIAQLNVRFTSSVNAKIEILSMIGQTIQTKTFDNTQSIQESIDLSNHAGGVYLVKILINNEKLLVRKLVLER